MNSYTELPIVNSSIRHLDSISLHAPACDNPSMEFSLESLNTSLLLPSLCTVLLSMISLILAVDQKRCIFLLGPAGILMMHITFGYSIIRTITSLGLLLFYAYEAYLKRHKKVDTYTEKSIAIESRNHKEGSFLLGAESNMVRKSIVDARRNLNPVMSDSSAKLAEELIIKRKKSLGPNISCFYTDKGGLVITRGEGNYLLDPDGNRYLDCCNNVAAVGHSHPKVVKAGIEAISMIQTNSRFLHPIHQRYSEKLLKTFPSDLDTVYLVNSGSEANDLALRIAKAHANCKGIAARPNNVICLDSAYHGTTQSLVDISPYKWYQSTDGKQYKGQYTHVAVLPDSFRGKYRGWNNDTGLSYAKEVEDIVENNGGVGVFIAESVVGCGGQVCLPPGYLSACHNAVRNGGGVVIADEVQTGFARSGETFWHFQTFEGVVPDIVTFGKPCGNGYPVAGVVCKREVADSFAKSGIEYFNTYGGNSVACSIAESVLDVIEEEHLLENAKRIGDYMIQSLLELQKDFDCIGDVRGQGLFLGVEFVVSRERDLTPDDDICKFVVDFLLSQRIIVSRDGPLHNVIKIKPPLVFSKADAEKLMRGFRSALNSIDEVA